VQALLDQGKITTEVAAENIFNAESKA